MKKIFYAFIILNLLLISCTNNDDNKSTDNTLPQENVILPKTIAITYPDFPQENNKLTMIYEGNKIVSLTGDIYKIKYTYNGNVIVKQEEYKLGPGDEETINERIIYEYENGKLKTTTKKSNFDNTHPDGDYTRKQVYTYKNDGTISYSQLDVRADIEYKRGDVNLTYKSGNLIKMEEINTNPDIPKTVFIYEYDDKYNPYKNILGFDLLLDETNYAINNIIKTSIKGRVNDIDEEVYNTTSIYNTNNYLIKSTSLATDGKTPEYIKEYTY